MGRVPSHALITPAHTHKHVCSMSAACLPRQFQNVIMSANPAFGLCRQYEGSPPAGVVQSAPMSGPIRPLGLPPRTHQAVNLRHIPRIEMLTAVRIVQVEHRHRRCSMAQRLGRSLRATSATSAFTGCQEHEQTALRAPVSATRSERTKQRLDPMCQRQREE